jgi:O-antigen ligase
VRRYGIGIAIPCALVGIPVMLLGGRSGEAADLSTEMRYDAWGAGLDMWHHSPIYGVGARAFTDHHYLTAHNSFVLSLAELGFVGLFLFATVIFLCIKTLIVGLRMLRAVPGSTGAQIWGMALLAGLGGIIFQINTLSFTYHPVLWMYIGLIGGWYLAVRSHVPTFEVKVKPIDAIAIASMCALYALVVLPLFLRAKGEL